MQELPRALHATNDMVLLGKLECTVNTADGVLEEFPEPHEDDKDSDASYPLKTVYIKAEEGKEFYVEFKAHYYALHNEPEYDRLALLVVLDAMIIATGVNSLIDCGGRKTFRRLPEVPFLKDQFDRRTRRNEHIPDERLDLREIKVIVIRHKLGIARRNPESSSSLKPIVAPEDTVHEKKIKIILEKNLTVSYSQPETFNRVGSPFHGIRIDSDTKPYAMFRFLYRSENALKDLTVIPWTPSVLPVPDELMSREDLLKELKKLREDNENMRTSVKRERKVDSDEELYSQLNHRLKLRMISKSQGGSTASEAIVLD
ncbi:hypothetical protein BDD12DRAFT_872414 [Trichophaea hybrida]|nr:hypothetical protein BDD12DRAFT_872414 [Trichophaea hybrida]